MYIMPAVYALSAQSVLIIFFAVAFRRSRKLALRLRCLNRCLIETQEEEHKRIARELHDDFGQRLALVKLELEIAMQEDCSLKEGASHNRWNGILAALDEIGNDMQLLSHTLHSGKLQYLGLKPALKELCAKFQSQHPIIIEL